VSLIHVVLVLLGIVDAMVVTYCFNIPLGS
jgi:hypothetical protein